MGIKYAVGDTVVTKKNHPCGGCEWLVTRTGADVRMKCLKCGSFVMIDAVRLEKRIKKDVRAHGGNADGNE